MLEEYRKIKTLTREQAVEALSRNIENRSSPTLVDKWLLRKAFEEERSGVVRYISMQTISQMVLRCVQNDENKDWQSFWKEGLKNQPKHLLKSLSHSFIREWNDSKSKNADGFQKIFLNLSDIGIHAHCEVVPYGLLRDYLNLSQVKNLLASPQVDFLKDPYDCVRFFEDMVRVAEKDNALFFSVVDEAVKYMPCFSVLEKIVEIIYLLRPVHFYIIDCLAVHADVLAKSQDQNTKPGFALTLKSIVSFLDNHKNDLPKWKSLVSQSQLLQKLENDILEKNASNPQSSKRKM